jgi:hypothetical protein
VLNKVHNKIQNNPTVVECWAGIDRNANKIICNHSLFFDLGRRKNQSENQSDIEEKSPEATGG